MSTNNITESKSILVKTCTVLLTVIFFILSFLTSFNNLVIFGLGVISLVLVILLSYKSHQRINLQSLAILLIPLVAYGVVLALSAFSSQIFSLTTRIFITINIFLFVMAGYLSKNIEGFSFSWIFKAIFISLSIICLINLIFTLVYYGPFYGYRLADYYSYYDGASSRNSISSHAFALCGFTVKEVPIEYYLLYPFLLCVSVPFYLLGDRKNKFNIILTVCFVLVALISLIFVISKFTLFFSIIYFVFIALISLLIIYKKLYNKPFKYTVYGLLILVGLFAIIFFLNSQEGLTGLRNLISSNGLLNHLFNANRYSESASIILNGVFGMDKIIGFPVYDGFFYTYPSNNIIVNQFMYGGLFAFVFFIMIIVLFVYVITNIKKRRIDDKNYKYFPLLFVVCYFAITLIVDQNSYDLFSPFLEAPNYLNPFFFILLFVLGHYYNLLDKEDIQHEE